MKRRIVLFWFLLSIFLVMPNQIRSVNAVSIMGNGTGGVYINIDNSVNSHYRSRNIVAYGPSSCTWFVVSRTEELTNININTVWGPTEMASYHPFNGNGFVYSSNKDALPTSGKAVAIYSNHVRIIEKVEGNNVLISEGGSTYYSDANHGYCVIRWMSKDDVKNKDGGLLGYIYFPNATYNQVPVGHVDRFYGSENPNYGAANGMIHMVGYAFDYDDTSQDLELHVYVGGEAGSGAGLYRVRCNHVLNTGVVDTYGNVGDHHGCVLAIPVNERGTKDVYVYAIDIGDTFTENPMIGHGTVTITDDGHTPRGEIYSVENKDNGAIRIKGWAYDPDTPSEGITLHVYVGGKAGTGANHYVVETNRPSNEYNYEFDFLIPVQERGEKDVYVYALDKGNPFTTNPVIGYGWVNITKTAKSPNGYIEKIEGSDDGTIHIQGWTWDPDDITQDLMLHVYVGGDSSTGAGPYRVQSNHIRCDLAIPRDMCDAVVEKHGDVGRYHGFDLTIPVNETGTKDVYVYAIDVGTPSKDNTLLRYETVTINKTIRCKTSSPLEITSGKEYSASDLVDYPSNVSMTLSPHTNSVNYIKTNGSYFFGDNKGNSGQAAAVTFKSSTGVTGSCPVRITGTGNPSITINPDNYVEVPIGYRVNDVSYAESVNVTVASDRNFYFDRQFYSDTRVAIISKPSECGVSSDGVYYKCPAGSHTFAITGQTASGNFNIGDTTQFTITSMEHFDDFSETLTVKLVSAINSIMIRNPQNTDVTEKTESVPRNSTIQLTASAEPWYNPQTFTWNSSNTSIAAVNSAGIVSYYGPGTVTITATSTDGGGKSEWVKFTDSSQPICKPGDVNGDGEVTGKDLMRLQRYLVDKTVVLICSGDVNGDGEITGKDLMRLQRYLVDKSVILY